MVYRICLNVIKKENITVWLYVPCVKMVPSFLHQVYNNIRDIRKWYYHGSTDLDTVPPNKVLPIRPRAGD